MEGNVLMKVAENENNNEKIKEHTKIDEQIKESIKIDEHITESIKIDGQTTENNKIDEGRRDALSPSLDEQSVEESDHLLLTKEEELKDDNADQSQGKKELTDAKIVKRKAKEKLGYVRSYNLSIFLFFDVNRSDAGHFIQDIEKIDIKFTQTFHIREFIKKFCPNSENIFLAIWDKYWEVFSRKGRITQQLSMNMEIHGSSVYRKSSYLDFFCFLFFFMSIEQKDILEFLFILWYSLTGLPPLADNMFKLAELLWSPVDNPKTIKILKDVKTVLKKFDKRNFHVSRLKVYDFRAKGAFSLPLISLQKELLKNMVTRDIWNRVIKSVRTVVQNPDMYGDTLHDQTLHGRKRTFQSKGERKYAKKDTDLFIDMLVQYQELRILELEHDEMFRQKNYLLTLITDVLIVTKMFVTKHVINRVLSQQHKVVPASYLVRKKYEKRFAALANEPTKPDDDDEYASKLVRKGVLKIPLHELNDEAVSVKARARDLVETCNKDLAAAKASVKEMLAKEAEEDRQAKNKRTFTRQPLRDDLKLDEFDDEKD